MSYPLIALSRFKYGNQYVVNGEAFDARSQADVRILTTLRMAKNAPKPSRLKALDDPIDESAELSRKVFDALSANMEKPKPATAARARKVRSDKGKPRTRAKKASE